MGPTADRVIRLLKLSTLGKLIALWWTHEKSPVLDQVHVSLNYSFTAVDGQDFCFTRSHLGWPSDPETMLRLFTNSTDRAWGHWGPASLGTPDIRLALPMLCLAVCLQPRSGSGCREKTPEQHTLPQWGEAWKAALRSDTHNTAGSLVFLLWIKKEQEKATYLL